MNTHNDLLIDDHNGDVLVDWAAIRAASDALTLLELARQDVAFWATHDEDGDEFDAEHDPAA
jgi:hypothetical protein